MKRDYRKIRPIGKGGMSSVWLAEDTTLGKRWAVKEIAKKKIENVAAFHRETELLKKLDHPALPRLVDIWEEREAYFLVMDYVEGKSLWELVRNEGVVEQRQVAVWGAVVCDVLTYLHERTPPVIFRDMKPSNLMLTSKKEIKLIDFGIAREFKPEKSEDTTCLGTRGYASPEQWSGRQTDARSDIYSLGVTMYFLLTGKEPSKPPYEIQPIRKVNKRLSDGLERIILKCCETNPERRYCDCQELKRDLQNYKAIEKKGRIIQKAKVGVFLFSFMMSGCGIVLSAMASKKKVKLIETSYEKLLIENEEKSLYDAISLMPMRIEAYEKLIAFYAESYFNREREIKLLEIILEYEPKLIQNEDYGNLCFLIGSLYWNIEREGAKQIRAAYPWFLRAYQNRGESYRFNSIVTRAYTGIGAFYDKINSVISYDSYSREDFKEFFSEMEIVVKEFQKQPQALADTRERFVNLSLDALEGFKIPFMEAGISEKQYKNLKENLRKVRGRK